MAKVLIVDDLEVMLQRIGDAFEEAGHEVVTANSGREGLNQLHYEDHSFDLIVSDIQMPEMNGLEFIANAKKMGVSCPIVVCSSDTSNATQEKAFELGVLEYFEKSELYYADCARELMLKIKKG